MCGLVGALRTKKSSWHKNVDDFIEQGLFVSLLRGMHGTGLGLVYENGTADVVKTHTDSLHFINSNQFTWAESQFPKCAAILGHTRAPTISNSVATKNSQPFDYVRTGDKEELYVLTHNGHISNHLSLTPNSFSHQVDSAHVAYAFAAEGAEVILPKLTGSYVLVWWHKKTRTLNIAKNEARSLYLAFGKKYESLYYASEEEFLDLLLRRNDIEIEGKIREMPSNIWYSWNVDKDNFQNFSKREYVEKKKEPVVKAYSALPGPSPYSGQFHGAKPSRNDWVWVEVPDNFMWVPYVHGNDESSNYGALYGTRNLNKGSVVKINGLKKDEWENKWYRIRSALPVTLTKVEEEKDTDGNPYLYLEGVLRTATAVSEYDSRSSRNALCSPFTPPADVAVALPDLTTAEIELVEGPEGKLISKAEWLNIAALGCYFCETKIMESEVGKVEWASWDRNPEDSEEDTEHQMICPICAADEQKMQSIL